MGAQSDGNGWTPKRRFLTLLFIDLCSSSLLASQLEFEPFAALLQRLRRAVHDAVVRQGGQVVRTQGDGSLAVFGHLTLSEHDTRHACQAALEAHAEVASWPALSLPGGPHPVALHSGVHAGLVYVMPGDPTRGDLDIVGDAANTAARLSAYAGPNEILADVESLGPELAFFDTGGVTEYTLPGRAVPVRAVSVRGTSGLRRRIDAAHAAGLSPLIGRDAPLAELVRACADPDDPRRVIEIRGPAGIGKTRLLDELAARLAQRGMACLRGGCESFGIAPVLEPFRQLVAVPAASSDAVRERALRMLVERDGGAFVVLLDDVLRATRTLRFVVASREAADDAGRQQASICPPPLTPAETRAIVEAWVPGANPFLVDELHEYAGGVPLLVEELCHTLRHRGEAGWRVLRHHGPRAGSGSWMKSMMAARLDSLGVQAWTCLQAAAVAGIRSSRGLLLALVPEALEEAVLKRLADADLLHADGADALRFRHGLSRDAVYELIPLERRVELHRRIVASFQQDVVAGLDPSERLEALAHHTRAAGDWTLATQHCEAAGDRASRLGAYDSARRQYLAAIEAAELEGAQTASARARWCLLIHRLAMTCMFDPLALPEALPLVERCVAVARELADHELLVRSLYWESYLRYVFGQPQRAARTALEAQTLAAAGAHARLLVQINATLGQALAAVCRYPEALAAMDTAVHAKQSNAQRSGALAIGSAFTLACTASVHADRGDFAAAHAALSHARELIAGQPNHPVANSVRNWEMVILAWQHRWDDVLKVVATTADLARRSRSLLPLAIAHAVGGYARWRLQRDPAAMTEVAEAVTWMENHQVHFFTSIYLGWLVEMAVSHGCHEEARRWAARLVRRARAGERLGEAVGWRSLALVAAREGDNIRAWRCLWRAEASARRRQSLREAALNAWMRARLLRETSRLPEAAQAEAEARAQLQAVDLALPD